MYTSTVATPGELVAYTKHCKDCGRVFVIAGAELHYPNEPVRCRECRELRRLRNTALCSKNE